MAEWKDQKSFQPNLLAWSDQNNYFSKPHEKFSEVKRITREIKFEMCKKKMYSIKNVSKCIKIWKICKIGVASKYIYHKMIDVKSYEEIDDHCSMIIALSGFTNKRGNSCLLMNILLEMLLQVAQIAAKLITHLYPRNGQ